MQRLLVLALALWIISVTATSCGNVKNLQYVQGQFDTARLSQLQFKEPVIQKGDLLGISIFSDDALATASVTTQVAPSSTVGTQQTPTSTPNSVTTGYLVDQQGNIQLYKLGIIQADGKTKKQLADTISSLYAKLELLKNPYVEVRFLNYKITLVGEIARPGSYSLPNDRVTAFEALALGGGITDYGRRDNVMVIREGNGVREFARLDFSKPDVFLSPYYYLQQNDMVIVDVSKNKAIVNNQTAFRTVSIGASLLSIAAILINIFRK